SAGSIDVKDVSTRFTSARIKSDKTIDSEQLDVAHAWRVTSDAIAWGQPCRLQVREARKLRPKHSQKRLKNNTFLCFEDASAMKLWPSVWRFVRKRHPAGGREIECRANALVFALLMNQRLRRARWLFQSLRPQHFDS